MSRARRMRSLGWLVAMIAALSACPPVDIAQPSEGPVNECPVRTCAGYTQASAQPVCSDRALCEVAQRSADYTLVVSLPESSTYAPGYTFLTKYSQLEPCPSTAVGSGGADTSAGTRPPCRMLPSIGEIAGSYGAQNNIAETVGFSLGGGQRSIPVSVTFRPAYSFDPGFDPSAPLTQQKVLLQDVAFYDTLDVQPIFAWPTTNAQFTLFGPSAPNANAPNVGFDASIPHGYYEETLAPAPPFDAAFPPLIQIVPSVRDGPIPNTGDPTAYTNKVLGLDDTGINKGTNLKVLGIHRVDVARSGGPALSLEGWRLFLRDKVTQRRISTVRTLHGPDSVTLFTINQTTSAQDASKENIIRPGVELVLHPSDAGPKLPDLVLDTDVGNVVPKVALYPLLPPNAIVIGSVVGPNGEPVRAQVDLVADGTAMADGTPPARLTVLEGGPSSDLRFVDSFATAGDGTFARALPPGTYRATITPDASSAFAKSTLKTLTVDLATPNGPDPVEKVLVVAALATLEGQCVTADGRPVADAEVEAHVSSSNVDKLEPARWPRTRRVPTGAGGKFTLPVLDPNATYDVVVRPATGTAFPWAVRPGIAVGGPGSKSELQIVVNAPYVLDFLLYDTGLRPVQDALVRAFAPYCAGTSDACAKAGGPWVPVEVGRAATDTNGHLQMFLDPVPLGH